MSVLREGYPFIFVGLCGLALLFGIFCIFFFRDPKIKITQGEGNILSPCNGTVMAIEENENEKIIRVFLSVFDVHLQRSPVAGTCIDVTYKKGKFLAAWDKNAHIENEQNIITIKADDGIYVVRQIAGLLARRCVSWVKKDDFLKLGKKIGMIKFSSQVDLHIPLSKTVIVKPKEKVKAGITVMAK